MRVAAHLSQSEFDVRCENGASWCRSSSRTISDVVVIVDVLSFTHLRRRRHGKRGHRLPLPPPRRHRGRIRSRPERAARRPARRCRGHLLAVTSPACSRSLPGVRLVLPSPNGSTLSLATGATPTLAGCLRNSAARWPPVPAAHGRRVAVIPCGERWPDDSLRPAVEDLIGAGAIISHLAGSKSPEAQTAQAVFAASRTDLARIIAACASGQELVHCGLRGTRSRPDAHEPGARQRGTQRAAAYRSRWTNRGSGRRGAENATGGDYRIGSTAPESTPPTCRYLFRPFVPGRPVPHLAAPAPPAVTGSSSGARARVSIARAILTARMRVAIAVTSAGPG